MRQYCERGWADVQVYPGDDEGRVEAIKECLARRAEIASPGRWCVKVVYRVEYEEDVYCG